MSDSRMRTADHASPGTHRHVFICGLHRSGTSLLHNILRNHPDISGFEHTGAPEDEGQHLQNVYPTGRVFGGPGKFCFDGNAHLTEHSPLVTEANKQALFDAWRLYWDLRKPLLLEKSPPNIIRSRFLQAMFPGSQFIFIVRHPIAVSLATQKWSGTSMVELIRHWQQAHQIMEDDMPHIASKLLIRYEDLIRNADDTVQELCAFLGISSPPKAVHVKRDLNDAYFKTWNEAHASDPDIRYDLSLASETASRYGYSFYTPFVDLLL